MIRSLATVFLLALISGCGFLAETVSDNVSLDLDTKVIPEASFASNDLAPLTVDFALDAANPSYTLDGIDTSAWVPMLEVERERRLDGGTCTLTDCGANFDMSMTSFALTGDYVVNFTVRIFSRPRADDLPGLIFPLSEGEEPVDVPACSFTLEPTIDDGDDYAAHLEVCLSDWLATNGIPMDFDMEVTSSQGGPRQLQDYSTTGFWEMDANQRISSGTSTEILNLDRDVVNNIELVDCSKVSMRGAGYTDTTLDEIHGSAKIYDAGSGTWVAQAKMEDTDLPAGNYFARKDGDDADLTVSDTRIQITFPGGVIKDDEGNDRYIANSGADNFMNATLEAASHPGSYGMATWYVEGPFPRSGSILVNLSGPCSFK